MAIKKQVIAAKEIYQEGRRHEAAGDTGAAVKAYGQVLQKQPLFAAPYNRLMIIFRKQKEYKKEKAIISQAIAAYENKVKEEVQTWSGNNKKSAGLNRSLAKALGLLGNKGLPLYEDAQVAGWRKRLAVVQKKI
ncbi:hypothetical protein [Niabella beijingensis]|uniref:hypothetical protein n=1 Tax=Niabella beijingensis TaxID=2872700 RepID=UPI001CBA703C|nr:hypothetical protein [Niabella beijingensis]MBZ4192174.1 hypothetical protein [Niabella beijingensis]